MDTRTVIIFILIVVLSVALTQLNNEQQACPSLSVQTFTQTRDIMDTSVTITVVDENEEHASRAMNNAFAQIDHVSDLMTSYGNSSQLVQLNERGQLDNADEELVYVLGRSKYYSNISDGAFDVTIKPVLDLWSSKFAPGGTHEPPTPHEIEETLELVNYTQIVIEGSNISLGENMSIVLGGIAKGYAVDKAIESLQTDGIKNGFVNAGGDGRYIGSGPEENPWKVGLQNPYKDGDAVSVMNIQDMAVATSGNYERYFSETAKVSHISDPRTGHSAQDLISSTIIAGSAMDADALATAVFVLGEKQGLEMIERLDNVECLIITSDRQIVRSSGYSSYETEEV
ncbi:MAG: FAD:protein FMN transferase [Euryarchaeota archaeon]|nr:FAD:protein FMN transferase [Euryarchaeota archaeon]